MNPRVSIVIACYNDLDVVKAVKHAYEQDYPNKEIIVVNDGSNNETSRAIASVDHFINIQINQKNQGQSRARNNGIGKATGEYILNWDSDDFFEPQFCKNAVEKLNQIDEIKIVTCKARRFNKDGIIDVFSPQGGNLEDFLFSNSALGSAMFRKIEWKECGGYEEDLPILGFEDWEFYIRLLKEGGYAYVIPEVLFNYQVRKNSTTDRIRNLKHEKFKLIILKHQGLYKGNFNSTMDYFFSLIESLEKEKIKILTQKEYSLGKLLLLPLRSIKKMFKR